ncbi:MAG: hypothetical protein V7749_17505 [Cocleimonas sp.]
MGWTAKKYAASNEAHYKIVNSRDYQLEENTEGLVGLFEMFAGISIEESILILLTLLVWISVYIYVMLQSKKGMALGIVGTDKIYKGLLFSILVALVSVVAIFTIQEKMDEKTSSILTYGFELVSLAFLAYAAVGFKELISYFRDEIH